MVARPWELINETKNIGDYICFKVALKDSVTSTSFTDMGEIEEIKKGAYYLGMVHPTDSDKQWPGDFFGLPGLILEINDGTLRMVCNKIVINPKEKYEIVEPRKCKKVSQ